MISQDIREGALDPWIAPYESGLLKAPRTNPLSRQHRCRSFTEDHSQYEGRDGQETGPLQHGAHRGGQMAAGHGMRCGSEHGTFEALILQSRDEQIDQVIDMNPGNILTPRAKG